MDLREIGLGGVDWIRLIQDRDRWRAVVSAVMNLRVLAPRSELVSYKRVSCILGDCSISRHFISSTEFFV
jgi:hypothetical protein